MLYSTNKKKKHLECLRQQVNQPYVGVIETTMMYQSVEKSKEHLISPTRYLVLIRFYEDFEEFDKRIKQYSRKCKISLPKLQKQQQQEQQMMRNRNNSVNSNDSKRSSNFRKILHSFSHKSSQKSNSDNIERYLRHCVNDISIQSCSLFKEFLLPQRDEDNVIPKQVVQSYVQQASCLAVDDQVPPATTTITDIITCTPTTPPPDIETVTTTTSTAAAAATAAASNNENAVESFISYTSFPSHHNDSPSSTLSSCLSNASDLPVTIQDFQLIKVIGRGCMGKVLLVRHRNSSRLLALKAISKRAVIEQSQIIHIKAEQQILSDIASIHHPFLIKLHYSFQDMNQLFLVLDYHVGGDLATQLRINHMLPPDRCRFYTAEIILGIQELHRLGILYRDLKPENVLLTADGHLVLTDFGLSKQFYDGLSLEEQRADTFCGTAEYLAPEILNGQPYSYQVDYWSMGTILFEMLTGITPFWAENRDDMYRRIRSDRLQFPDFIDIETADFIARLLKRDPNRRLGSGSDGAIRVRSDPYFEFIDWNLIYTKRIRPPYIPNLYSETDFSHFDSEFLRLTPRLSPVGSDYILSQSLDRAFEGYSYTNREENLLDSPPSELYSLNDPMPPITLLDTNNQMDSETLPQQGTRYFTYNDSDEVVPYDESNISSNDDIRSSDFVRSSNYQPRFSDEEEDNIDDDDDEFNYYRQLPPRPTTRRHLSLLNDDDDDDDMVTSSIY
ncbi:hypothetical protein HPULCUR_000460 [Helicostylum pulchrum]|uniref:Uncharacterized protein n=1 Tax=Helicostylum pulchrum TaxID=562976 RepID=A0ABP9XL21_9FUNG